MSERDDDVLPTDCVTKNEDGSISIRLTPEDLATMEAEEPDEDALAPGRKDYCCRCGNGDLHNVRASSRFSAIAKCAGKCLGPFSVRSGRC